MSDSRTGAAVHSHARYDRDRLAVRDAIAELQGRCGVAIVLAGVVTENRNLLVCESAGLTASRLAELNVHTGSGVGGRVLASGKPFGVTDYTRSGVISHEYDQYVRAEGVKSVAAIPVIVFDTVRAVLYAAMRSSARFEERTLAEMTAVGRRLEQRLAVADACDDPDLRLGVARSVGNALPTAVSRVGGRTYTELPMSHEAALIHERMRETHAKLRVLASRTDDPITRMELESIAGDLVAPASTIASAKLSRRELDVLACVAQGKTNIETGQIMGIGAETVKSYLRSAMRKLDAHTRYEAVNVARRLGALP